MRIVEYRGKEDETTWAQRHAVTGPWLIPEPPGEQQLAVGLDSLGDGKFRMWVSKEVLAAHIAPGRLWFVLPAADVVQCTTFADTGGLG